MGWIQMSFVFLRSLLRSQSVLAAENLALRQQPAILEQCSKRPRNTVPDLILDSDMASRSVHAARREN